MPPSASANVEQQGGILNNLNSQTMNLLEVPVNVGGKKDKPEILIVQSALATENGPQGVSADIESEERTSNLISTYIVVQGDTISGIAKKFNVSSNTIRWSNGLKKDTALPVGKKLLVLPVSGVQIKVAKGDTIASIAKKYKGDSQDIIDYNGLSDNQTLAIGDTLIIPDGEMTDAPAKSSTKNNAGSLLKKIIGFFMRPADGPLSQGLHGHNGIDISGSIGSPIYAAAAGEVIVSQDSGWNGGYGSYVVVAHDNGTQTLYAHMSKDLVSPGEKVVQGQVIGKIGNTGKATGPHLHFEVRGAYNPFQ